MSDLDRIENNIVMLRSRIEALEFLLALVVARLDEDTLESILGDVPNADVVRSTSANVRPALLPPPFDAGVYDQIYEDATVSVFEKFQRNVRRRRGSF
ncbi:MAG: hypothetical protein OXM58_15705 [Rhodospirillaceae bacterium]|nr:hypothetical protein [Rhodospirillaceae bacterium]MDE0619721.1 hypothetical protein [Rhodospirillaceae bacterium]